MSSVLFDNSSLHWVHHYAGRNGRNSSDFKHNPEFQNFIYASLLWDSIYCLDYTPTPCLEFVAQFSDGEFDGSSLREDYLLKISYENDELRNTYNSILRLICEHNNCSTDSVIFGTDLYEIASILYYTEISEKLGSALYLTKERQNFISQYGLPSALFDRRDIIDLLDKSVCEYYSEINKQLGKSLVRFSTPLLVDYVCQNASNGWEAVDIIGQLASESSIKSLRSEMSRLENALRNGNYVEFRKYIDYVNDITNKVTQEFHTPKVDLSIGLSPSINIPIGGKTHSTLSKKNKINLHFLSDLATFGLKNRPL